MDEHYSAPTWQTVDVRSTDPESAANTADGIIHNLGYAQVVQTLTAKLTADASATSRTIGVASRALTGSPIVFQDLLAAGRDSVAAYRDDSVYPEGSHKAFEMFADRSAEDCVPELPPHFQSSMPGPSGYFRVEKRPDATIQVSVGHLNPDTRVHSVLQLPPTL